MKRTLLIPLIIGAVLFLVSCGAPKQLSSTATGSFQYELEGVNNGAQGFYLIKVWTYSNSQRVDVELCKKNAVHGIIFKGYAAGNNVRPQGPLVKEPGAESLHADYFNNFFADGGEYNRYVTVTSGTQEIVKVGKRYKIGLIVSVSKDQLRKTLESAGIVKSLNHGF